jgi:hypothetical protein
MTAFLRQIRRRHVDRDAFRRQREPGRYQCGAHTLLRFGYRLVRKSDEIERWQPGRHLDLHVNGPRLHAFKGDRRDVLNHSPPPTGRLPHKLQSIKNISRTGDDYQPLRFSSLSKRSKDPANASSSKFCGSSCLL